MRAAVATGSSIEVRDDVADPTPGPGQVLVHTMVCGICGSDLHALAAPEEMAQLNAAGGAASVVHPGDPYVLGHEFTAEIVDYGPETGGTLRVGSVVCALPYAMGPAGLEVIGFSPTLPGGFGELMVLQEAMLMPVPEGLDARTAALTEPLAVGEHAVGLARLEGDEACLVVGCGPIGLAVIAALRARGMSPVVAADFSPARRRLAERFGADEVVDPAAASPHARWEGLGVPVRQGDLAALEVLGGRARRAVVFEAVGLPGVLQAIIRDAPPRTRVVVVGVCMQTDRIEPFFAAAKELELRFAFGYTRAEFAATLDRLAGGGLPAGELVTGLVGLDGVAGAFDALRRPAEHGKVLVRP